MITIKNFKLLYAFIFLLLLLISFSLKFFSILNDNFPFTTDQGRDMLDIRSIVDGHHLRLIGPTTSINGVYLGPFYYYFNVLPYIFGGGDPSFLVYWNIFWYILTPLLVFHFLKKADRLFAFLATIFFLMAPAFFYSSRYFWSANPMPYFTILYFLSLFSFLIKPNYINASLVGLISGLSMQIEAAFGVILLPFAFLTSLFVFKQSKSLKKHTKKISLLFGFFALTLLPQIFFELRHNFVMTKTFFGELSGKSSILGEKLNSTQVVSSHFKSFVENLTGSIELPEKSLIILFLISMLSILYRIYKKQASKITQIFFFLSVSFLIFAFVFYLFYQYPLKGWYLMSLRVPIIFIYSSFFSEIFQTKKLTLILPTSLLLGIALINTATVQLQFVPKNISDRSGDKSNLRNELEAIDWVYQKANSEGFKVYNYIPSVYDYPYQYLFWWHGTKKYGYQPDTITYRDNVPEYVDNNLDFLTKRKAVGNNPLIFLIYEKDENPERLSAWLGNFTSLCVLDSVKYPWQTSVELRKSCKTP